MIKICNKPEKFWDYSNKKRKKIKTKFYKHFNHHQHTLPSFLYFNYVIIILIILMDYIVIISPNNNNNNNNNNNIDNVNFLNYNNKLFGLSKFKADDGDDDDVNKIKSSLLTSSSSQSSVSSPSSSASSSPLSSSQSLSPGSPPSTTVIVPSSNTSDTIMKKSKIIDTKNVNVLKAKQEQEHQQEREQQPKTQKHSADDDEYFDGEDEFDEYEMLINNKSAKGMYVGAPCENKCDTILQHVHCDELTGRCTCDRAYPVNIGLRKGCAKPKKLGDQCFYDLTCIYSDENSLCTQVRHNAMCQCKKGYHSVSYAKPTKRVFCTQDMATLTSDLPTLLGVTSGIAVLAGLICMVLHLFSKTKYPRHRNFADANLPPPIMYSTDTVNLARPSSRTSLRSSNSIGSYTNRRPSSAPHMDSSNNTINKGSRRPSLASVHSTSSSIKSYSMIRFEKELQQKELRHEMKFRLTRLQQQQQQQQQILHNSFQQQHHHHHHNHNHPQNHQLHQQNIIVKPHITIIGDPLLHHGNTITKTILHTTTATATAMGTSTTTIPSPITPSSTDELLPAVDESQEFLPIITVTPNNAYTGPCTSSSEGLSN